VAAHATTPQFPLAPPAKLCAAESELLSGEGAQRGREG